ncbi:MAG TPA: pyridoxal-dependent decarboxylase, partial [Candidatus Angelobacter sp.]|nr:pyridoxal-dependent decarboxylase [Candidatus Angelobacter sp.]
ITCDAHKWLAVPMGCGMFFCRHADTVAQAFRTQTTYMPGVQSGGASDPLATSIQWSRRFIGLKLFMALAEQGEAGYAAMIDRQVELGELLRELLNRSGWRVMNETPLPLVCFTRDGLDIPKLLSAMRERQTAWMSSAEIRGTPVIRACITSFRTTRDDIRWVVDEITKLAISESVVRSAH